MTKRTKQPRRRRSPAERREIEQAALSRARGRLCSQNDAAVIRAFTERGIPASEIEPRVNVLTFNAWRALGRTVCKGEKGERVTVWIPIDAKPGDDAQATSEKGALPRSMRPKTAVVFHITQTKPLEQPATA